MIHLNLRNGDKVRIKGTGTPMDRELGTVKGTAGQDIVDMYIVEVPGYLGYNGRIHYVLPEGCLVKLK